MEGGGGKLFIIICDINKTDWHSCSKKHVNMIFCIQYTFSMLYIIYDLMF